MGSALWHGGHELVAALIERLAHVVRDQLRLDDQRRQRLLRGGNETSTGVHKRGKAMMRKRSRDDSPGHFGEMDSMLCSTRVGNAH